MSLWSDEELDAVRSVKLSSAYRRVHAELRSPRPAEVWADPETGRRFVTFDARSESERIYLFAVIPSSGRQELVSVHRVTSMQGSWTSEPVPL